MIHFPLSLARGEGRCAEVWVVVLTAVGGGAYLGQVTHRAWARGRGTAEGPCGSHGQRGMQPAASAAREDEGHADQPLPPAFLSSGQSSGPQVHRSGWGRGGQSHPGTRWGWGRASRSSFLGVHPLSSSGD